jgi:hypothetical protein
MELVWESKAQQQRPVSYSGDRTIRKKNLNWQGKDRLLYIPLEKRSHFSRDEKKIYQGYIC